jgi:hypothetical protein
MPLRRSAAGSQLRRLTRLTSKHEVYANLSVVAQVRHHLDASI